MAPTTSSRPIFESQRSRTRRRAFAGFRLAFLGLVGLVVCAVAIALLIVLLGLVAGWV